MCIRDSTVSAKVYSLANELLFQATDHKDIAADSTASVLRLDLEQYLAKGMVLVSLELHDPKGALVSQNLYWLGARPASYRELNSLVPTPVSYTHLNLVCMARLSSSLYRGDFNFLPSPYSCAPSPEVKRWFL